MFGLSQMGKAVYDRAQENITGGMTPEDALMIEEYKQAHKFEPTEDKTSTEQLRDYIFNDDSLTVEQKTMLDKEIIGNKYTPGLFRQGTVCTSFRRGCTGAGIR